MPWVRVLRNHDPSPPGGYFVDIPNRALGPWCATIPEAKRRTEAVMGQPLAWQEPDAPRSSGSVLVASAYVGYYPLP